MTFAKVVESRATAGVAMVGLMAGLLTLAGLALWSSVSAQRTTAHVGRLNEISERWNQISHHLTIVDNSMRDILRTGTDVVREPLASSAGAGRDHLVWLQNNGGPADVAAANRISGLYGDYTAILKEMLALGDRGDTAGVVRQADQATLAFVSLRKQLTAIVQEKSLETTEYLRNADLQNRRLRVAQIGASAVDVGLVGLFGLVLLGHRRKILRQAAKNEHEALHDSLTGLANRALLADRAGQAVREARRGSESVGLLLIDLDRFKEVNDTLGHHCGDVLLRQVAARLAGAVREVDTVARLGGDEFAVLLPRVGSAGNACQVANRILAALGTPVNVDGLALEVGASIGVALFPTDSADTDDLLRHADIAMYAAKRGNLGIAVYEPSLDQRSTAQLTLMSELRRAIDNGDLVLHYQPKAAASDGSFRGVEALARWPHPHRGLLGPEEFIPSAEDSGLIEPLTLSVLDIALAQCRSWRAEGFDVPVAVNVGVRCLLDSSFPDQVSQLLTRHELPASVLTLEITESAIIADPSSATDVLTKLGDLGVRLSIDDFGTGFSSIAYLRSMPVHEMKLDRSFVTHMRFDAGNTAIVSALVDLAHNFDLHVVAEGVEDRETWTALATLGCDTVQGYFLSQPLPAAELTSWLASHTPAPVKTYLRAGE